LYVIPNVFLVQKSSILTNLTFYNSSCRLIFPGVIAAWGRSRRLGKAARARRVLNKMIKLQESGHLDSRPDPYCYTAVINACAHCINDEADKRESLRIAIETYKELEKFGKPNHVTYVNLFNAFGNLLPPSPQRSIAALDVFRTAIQNGFVDSVLIQRLKCKGQIEQHLQFGSCLQNADLY
jgi:hypothetical protein